MPLFTPDEMKKLDEQSNENMLVFYEKEMRLVSEGLSPSSFLTKPLIKRFVELGILERSWKLDEQREEYRRVTLSQKGKEWYNLHSASLP